MYVGPEACTSTCIMVFHAASGALQIALVQMFGGGKSAKHAVVQSRTVLVETMQFLTGYQPFLLICTCT